MWWAFTSRLPLDLTHSDSTLWVNLELTSRCNLRCVYCSKSTSEEESKRVYDFPEEWITPSLKTLRQRGLWLIVANSVGESTLRKGWREISHSFLDSGISLAIISHFARPFSDEDVATLIRFNSIQVSVDTADPELFKLIRRGSRLEIVLANIDLVIATAKAKGVRPPDFCFDVVVTDKTVHGLEDLVRLGLAHGIKRFYFANLIKGDDVKGPFNVYNANTLPKAELAKALDVLERACEMARLAGCEVDCHSGLVDSLRSELTSSTCQTTPSAQTNVTWGAPAVQKGMTRDCAEPWKYAQLCAHGEVRPCCASTEAMGDLRTETLESILNGPKLKKFRNNLLTGELEGTFCMNCSMKPQIPIKQFQREMSGRLVLWSLRRRALNLVQSITRH